MRMGRCVRGTPLWWRDWIVRGHAFMFDDADGVISRGLSGGCVCYLLFVQRLIFGVLLFCDGRVVAEVGGRGEGGVIYG